MRSAPAISKRLHTAWLRLWDAFTEVWRHLTDFSVRPLCTNSCAMGMLLGSMLAGLPWLAAFNPWLALFAGLLGLFLLKLIHADLPDTRTAKLARLKARHQWLNDGDNLVSEVIQQAKLTLAEAEALKQLRATLQVCRDQFYREWRAAEDRSPPWFQQLVYRGLRAISQWWQHHRLCILELRREELTALEQSLALQLRDFEVVRTGVIDSGLACVQQKPKPAVGSEPVELTYRLWCKLDKRIDWLTARLQAVRLEKSQVEACHHALYKNTPEEQSS